MFVEERRKVRTNSLLANVRHNFFFFWQSVKKETERKWENSHTHVAYTLACTLMESCEIFSKLKRNVKKKEEEKVDTDKSIICSYKLKFAHSQERRKTVSSKDLFSQAKLPHVWSRQGPTTGNRKLKSIENKISVHGNKLEKNVV